MMGNKTGGGSPVTGNDEFDSSENVDEPFFLAKKYAKLLSLNAHTPVSTNPSKPGPWNFF